MSLKTQMRFEGSRTLVIMTGWIDEKAVWPEVNEPVPGDLILDLQGVELINSLGLRDWIQWLCGLRVKKDIVLIHCGPVVVRQFHILEGAVRERMKIESVYVPYFCEDCGFEEQKLLQVSKLPLKPSAHDLLAGYPCPKCGMNMDLDLIESQFIAFLIKQRAKFAAA